MKKIWPWAILFLFPFVVAIGYWIEMKQPSSSSVSHHIKSDLAESDSPAESADTITNSNNVPIWFWFILATAVILLLWWNTKPARYEEKGEDGGRIREWLTLPYRKFNIRRYWKILAIFAIVAVLLFFGAAILEQAAKTWNATSAKWTETKKLTLNELLIIIAVAAGLLLLAWRFRKFSLLGAIAGAFALVHAIIYFGFTDFWLAWASNKYLFWLPNVTLMAMIFFSRVRGGGYLVAALLPILAVILIHHFQQSEADDLKAEIEKVDLVELSEIKWSEKKEKKAVKSPTIPSLWIGTTYPERVPGLVEKTGLPGQFNLDVRNLRVDKDSLSYDIWSRRKGRGKIGWAKLTRLPHTLGTLETLRYSGEFHRSDTRESGSIWLEPAESGKAFRGQASWTLSDGTIVQCPTELELRSK